MEIIYRAKDGEEFTDDYECWKYEFKLSYGYDLDNIRFLDKEGKTLSWGFDGDDFYNSVEYMSIPNYDSVIALNAFGNTEGYCAFQIIREPGEYAWNDEIDEFEHINTISPPALLVLIGTSGSGKSYFAKHSAEVAIEDYEIFSSDEIRKELYGDESIQDNPRAVFRILHSRLLDALIEGKRCIYDATNLRKKDRERILQLVEGIPNLKAVAVVIEASDETIALNQSRRERQVSQKVIERQKNLMKYVKEDIKNEPWTTTLWYKNMGDSFYLSEINGKEI